MPSPHVHYLNGTCPHPDCELRLELIDFRLEVYEDPIERPLMLAWYQGAGFVGACPRCARLIHFSNRTLRAVGTEEANGLPRLPLDWHNNAHFLEPD